MNEALVKKLRLPSEGKIAVFNAPEGFLEQIGLDSEQAVPMESDFGTYVYVQLFAANVADVDRLAPNALRAVHPAGIVWLCYPKGTSKIKTDLNRDSGWSTVLAAGWEGVSLVSVDDTWSAMRFRPVGAAGPRPRSSPDERKSANKVPAVPLETPADLRAALAEHPAAAAFFEGLAPSHRKEYIVWIIEAKREETRSSRILKAIEKLDGRLKRPSDK
ncbi:hypothetical protein D7Z26_13020 [Cohnella endophytica]|uniref:YdeI/OmpD-associated family protein n=1 Tax=Cohnella endophytica TaxID=2419778 RepID=A0A494Y1R3_9BACL|nr:YdeI/OmpD-associated family protein [Cohnella endophytica]RKP54282.1 hypothetical protein D7Z26_13020 [Cohnella endophytica]